MSLGAVAADRVAGRGILVRMARGWLAVAACSFGLVAAAPGAAGAARAGAAGAGAVGAVGTGGGQAHYRSCGYVALRSPPGFASGIRATGITCVRARRIVAGSPSRRYLYTGGRFRASGFGCRASPAAFWETHYVCRREAAEITYTVPE